ncbi:MAG: 30S ribosomal protein S17 [Candidatus Kerfeldbacteria bacterium]|nr:30S ribosomal protein S17 [Candidatus Kerfeldbacteria bacterium]
MTTNQPAAKIQRTFRGVVVKNAMQKTIVVKVTRVRWHSKYHRQYRVSHTFQVHDEQNSAKIGETVEFVETRPLSKEKRWRLVKKVEAK